MPATAATSRPEVGAATSPTPVGWALRVLAWVVILGAVGLLAAAVLVPRVAGATPYAVLTGSMQPGLPPGTLIVVRPVDDADLALGDVVTYQLESGEAPVVTHRVVAMGYDGLGELRLQTQGDANDVPDAAWVRPIQVRGELWYSVPLAGYPHTWLSGQEHERLVQIAAGGLIGYAAWMFLGAVRTRRRSEPTPGERT